MNDAPKPTLAEVRSNAIYALECAYDNHITPRQRTEAIEVAIAAARANGTLIEDE